MSCLCSCLSNPSAMDHKVEDSVGFVHVDLFDTLACHHKDVDSVLTLQTPLASFFFI